AMDAEIGERLHRAVAPGDAQMTHAAPGLAAEAGADHLVVAPQRAVEEHERRAAQPGFELVVERGTGGDIVEALADRRRRDVEADGVLRTLRQPLLDTRILEIERDLAGHAERLDAEAAGRAALRQQIGRPVERDR